jgi:type I restriction enzyme S subunit
MKGYSNYKDSGIEWIGEIPNGWKVIKLKWLTQIKRGASPRPIDDLKYFDENGEFSWVRISDVSASERYLENTKEKLSELGASLSVKQYPGDFFLSIAGSVGKPIITKIKCCIHDGFVWFPELKINPEYLYYIFRTGLPFVGLGKIGTQLNLNTETIGNIVIPHLSNEDIQKIVFYLDYKTDIIDTTIEKKKRLIELLKEKRQAVINEAVTKGLNPNAPMKDTGVEWLGEIPNHWKIKKMRYLCEITTGGKDTENREENGEYPFFVRSQTVERISTYSFDGEAILTAGDGVGVCKVWHYINGKFDFHQRVYMLSNFKEVIGKYLFEYLRENFVHEVLKLSAKSTVDSLRRPMFLNFTVVVPPISEQIEIVSLIEKQTSLINLSIEKIEVAIEKLIDYRQSLISEAVTGKIDVRDWQSLKKLEVWHKALEKFI